MTIECAAVCLTWSSQQSCSLNIHHTLNKTSWVLWSCAELSQWLHIYSSIAHLRILLMWNTQLYMCPIITHFEDTLFSACMWIYLLFRAKTSRNLLNWLLHIDSQYCKMRSTLNDYNVAIMFSRSQLLWSFTILTTETLVNGVTKERRDAFIPGVMPDIYDSGTGLVWNA